MVIKEEKALMISEVHQLLGDSEKDKELKVFIEKFGKINLEKDKSLRNSLEKLEIIKLKERHLVKIVDFKPTTAIELNKVVSDVTLDNEEVNKILETIKNE